MKKDILIAGVGGQGILSVAFVLDNATMEAGFHFKQTEVHGMAQRGGGVVSHVRISDQPVHSDVISFGQADVILGIEPLEALRYTDYLKADGYIISNSEPFINIPNYPEIDKVLAEIKSYPNHIIFDAKQLAKQAGHLNAQNMVLLGALSNFLPIEQNLLQKWLKKLFQAKGEKVVDLNICAFNSGKEAAKNQ